MDKEIIGVVGFSMVILGGLMLKYSMGDKFNMNLNLNDGNENILLEMN